MAELKSLRIQITGYELYLMIISQMTKGSARALLEPEELLFFPTFNPKLPAFSIHEKSPKVA